MYRLYTFQVDALRFMFAKITSFPEDVFVAKHVLKIYTLYTFRVDPFVFCKHDTRFLKIAIRFQKCESIHILHLPGGRPSFFSKTNTLFSENVIFVTLYK